MAASGRRSRVVVVGAGHNGLIAACYLARAGREVIVLEQAARPGGGARSEATIPGLPDYRFDLHSVAHNIINMTAIPAELALAEAGLDYIEMNPFSVAIRADGTHIRFYRSIEATVEAMRAVSRADAEAYAAFMRVAVPLVRSIMPAIRGETHAAELPGRLFTAARLLRHGPTTLARDLLGPYDALLKRWLASDLTRGPVAAFAAHSDVGPSTAGGSLYAFWQAAYHLFGQWHARGGAQALTDALLARLASYDVRAEVRCDAAVARIAAPGGRVRAVELESGERIAADAVITAMDPQTALLRLLDPPLAGRDGADLAAARRSNVVQALVHVATDRLPAYPNATADDYTGLQSYVDTLEELRQGFIQAEAGALPDPLPLYAFTTSAIDPTLAPAGGQTVYLACPAAPGVIRGGWDEWREPFAERCLEIVERRAPGFRASIQGYSVFTPADMERAGRWPIGHPMVLDLALDQLGPLRPTRRLGDHRTPVRGLYISGAGTNPAGGIAGTPGRMAARALLRDLG
jgi:phytoene dehydrogenase-like protein